MDIILLYKKSRSGELEYAVKSLDNLDYDRLLILDGSITLPRWGKGSWLNQLAKLEYACSLKDLSDPFLATADDVFVLDEWEPINYNKGSLQDHIDGRRVRDSYTRSLIVTKNWLEDRGLPTLSFELHTPFLYEKQKLKDLIDLMPKDNALQVRSLYGNYYKIDTEYMQDCKNPKDYEGKTILSTNEHIFAGELGSYIRGKLDA